MKQGARRLRRVRGPRRRQRDLRGAHPVASASSRPSSARAYGVSGSNLRASGVDWDLRRDGRPYLAYDELDWKVWTHPDGDSFARYWVRLQETRESARMVLQLLDGMPSGPIMAKVPRIIKVPEGEAWVDTENPLGEMGYYVVSQGRDRPVPGEDPLGVVQQRVDPAVAAARRVRARRHHDPRAACTSSSGTSTDDRDPDLALQIGWGTTLAIKTVIVLGDRPARRADPRLRLPAQDDEPHAEPARSDGPRRLPRLVPAHRRRPEVHPEGGHHAGRGRPARLRARARRRRAVDVPRLRRDPRRPATSSSRPSTSASSTRWRCRASR